MVPEPVEPHRPRVRYTLRLDSRQDVETARSEGVPVFLLDPAIVTSLGHRMKFPPFLLVPRAIRPSIRTRLRVIEMESESSLREPKIEELVVALLRFDEIAARAVVLRNARSIDRVRLYRAVAREGLEREATRVHLSDFAPIPVVGSSLEKGALDRIALRNTAPVGGL